MSKRTPGLPQRPRGFWPTPREAVVPLIPMLPRAARYGEPLAGNGALVGHLSELWPGGQPALVSDIHPEAPGIMAKDVMLITKATAPDVDMFISNPPWPKTGQNGDPALGIILHLITIAPCWMLLPWDFAANIYFGKVARFCETIVPIGRVSWLGNGRAGTDNVAWFYFSADNEICTTIVARS